MFIVYFATNIGRISVKNIYYKLRGENLHIIAATASGTHGRGTDGAGAGAGAILGRGLSGIGTPGADGPSSPETGGAGAVGGRVSLFECPGGSTRDSGAVLRNDGRGRKVVRNGHITAGGLTAAAWAAVLAPTVGMLPGVTARIAGEGAWLAPLVALPAALLLGCVLTRLSRQGLAQAFLRLLGLLQAA